MARAARRIAGLVCVSLLTIALASAWMQRELPTGAPVQVRVDESRPRVDEIRPQGIRRGFATELSFRGAALSGNPRLVAPFRFVEKTAASGSDATKFRTRLTVDRDTALGVYPVRVLTDEGLTAPFGLAVEQLPQTEEKENNDDFWKTAQRIVLPTVIEGELPEGDHDSFRFQGKKGQRIVGAFDTGELGSGIDVTSNSLLSPDHKFSGRLSLVPSELPNDDDYRFDVQHQQYHPIKSGRRVYRLTIGELPTAIEVFPLGGRRGETIRVELRGGTIKGVKVLPVKLEPAPGESIVRLRITSEMRGADGTPLDFESLPPLVVSDLPEVLEPTAADAPPLQAAAPVVLNGRIDPAGVEDRFTLSVKPGQKLRAEVAAGEIGSALLAVLKVLDARGTELAKAYSNQYNRASFRKSQGFEYLSFDPAVEFMVPDGQSSVTLVVLDYFSDPVSFAWDRGRVVKPPARGGVGFPYRLTVVPVEPEFEVSLNDAQVIVPKGGTAAVGVRITRNGYNGPITLHGGNLPPGLTFRAGSVADRQTVGAFTLAAAADAAAPPFFVDVVGEGQGPAGPIIKHATKVILFGEPTTMAFRVKDDEINGKPTYTEFPPYLRTRIRTQPGLWIATVK